MTRRRRRDAEAARRRAAEEARAAEAAKKMTRRRAMRYIIGGTALVGGAVGGIWTIVSLCRGDETKSFRDLVERYPTFARFGEALASGDVEIGKNKVNGVSMADALLYLALDNADKRVRPKITTEDVSSFKKSIGELAGPLRSRVNDARSLRGKVRAVTDRVYREGGFTYAEKDMDIVSLVKSGRGYCEDFTALFLVLADECGLDARPVPLPRHVFPRFRDSSGQSINVETTSQGRFVSDDWYKSHFGLEESTVEKGIYLKDVPLVGMLAYGLNNRINKMALGWPELDEKARESWEKTMKEDIRIAKSFNPDSPTIYYNEGLARFMMSDPNAVDSFQEVIDPDPNFLGAYLFQGITYELSGRPAQAIKSLEGGIERGIGLRKRIKDPRMRDILAPEAEINDIRERLEGVRKKLEQKN